jgi:membrane-associated protease RseP (regulator of RpoE activity)
MTTNLSSNLPTPALLLAALTLSATLVAPATAQLFASQPAPPQPPIYSSIPLRSTVRSDAASVKLIFIKNADRYEVTKDPDHASPWRITRNDKPLPQDRWSINSGKLTIRDEQGNPIIQESLPTLDAPATLFRTTPGPAPQPPVSILPTPTPRARLGVVMVEASEDLVTHLGLPEGNYAVITQVQPGTAAADAGLLPSDLLLSIDDRAPGSSDLLREVIAAKQPGDTVKLEIIRRGERQTIQARLSAAPERQAPAQQDPSQPADDRWSELATRLAELGARAGEEAARFGQEKGEAARTRAQEMVEKLRRDFEGQGSFRLALPRASDRQGQGGQGLMLLTEPSAKQQELEARVKELEAQVAELRKLVEKLAPPSTP